MAESDQEISVGITADPAGLETGANSAADVLEAAVAKMTASFDTFAERMTAITSSVVSDHKRMASGVKESTEEVEGFWGKMVDNLAEGGEAVKANMEGIASRVNGISKTFALFSEVFVAGFIGEQVVELGRQFAEYGEQVEHTAQQTGMSTDAVQKLGFAARETGVSAERMNMAMSHVQLQMVQAERGVKQSQAAFAALGISMEELKGMGTEEVILKVADAFKAHADNANKSAVVQMLFGRGAQDLIPVLNKGSEGIRDLGDEAKRLGGVMSEESIAKAAALSSEFTKMDTIVKSLKLQLGEALVPALNAMGEAMVRDVEEGGGFKIMLDTLKTILESIAIVATLVAGTFDEIAVRAEGAWRSIQKGKDFMNPTMSHDEFISKWGNGSISDETDATLEAHQQRERATIDQLARPEMYEKGAFKDQTDRLGGSGEGEAKPSFNVPAAGKKGGGNKGQFAIANAEAQVELAKLKDSLAEASQIYQEEYNNGRISLQQYYAARLQIVQAGLTEEIKIKRQELAEVDSEAKGAKDESQKNQLLAKRIALLGQIDIMQGKLDRSASDSAREQLDAEKKLNDALTNGRLQAMQSIQAQVMTQERALAAERVKLGLATQQDLIALDEQMEQQRYQLEMQRLQTALNQLGEYELQKRQQISSQIEVAQAQHQTRMTQLEIQSVDDRMKYQEQAMNSIEGDFSSLFENLMSGQKKVTQVFMDFFNQVYANINKMVAQDLTRSLFDKNGGGGGDLLSKGLGFITGRGTGGSSAMQDMNVASAANVNMNTIANQMTQSVGTITIMSAGIVNSPGGGGGGGGSGDALGGLLGGLGNSSDFGGSFGFTATGATGSTDAVISGLGSGAGDSAGMSALMGLASFDSGTNYVPNDMLAMIHKGEAVVPARYNAAGTGAGASHSVTNNFALTGPVDRRTMQQIAVQAGSSIQMAMRRNT